MRIFISHSSTDKNKIEGLILALERLRCDVFYSSKSYSNKIQFGENFYSRIRNEIKESDYILAILSESFYSSIPCQIEMGIAYAYNKLITPIGVEEKEYNKLLIGLFTSNDRLARINNEYDMIELLSLFSKEISKVVDCARNIVYKFNQFNEVSSKNKLPNSELDNENGISRKTSNYNLPNNLRGRNINEKVIPTVCNLKKMLNKLLQYNGDFSKLEQWEKRSYKAYNIEDIKSQIIYSPETEWVKIIRKHILDGTPSNFGASCIDIYLVAYVSETYRKGKDKFFEYVKTNNISDKPNSAQAIWQVGKGDGVYLDILNDDGTIKDWDFIKEWTKTK